MGIALPQVVTQSKASGAQIVDDSLKFDSGISQYLSRTPGSAGNRNTWTWSGWVKRGDVTTSGSSLFAAYDSSTARDVLRFDRSTDGAELNLQSSQSGSTYGIYSNSKLRDTGWYHVVAIYDDSNSTTADKQQLYVNGQRLTSVSTENNGQDGGQTTINNTDIHYIGARSSSGTPSLYFDGAMSQVYFIDGQALGPENFGFTDPLTNTWRPKKYTGTFGTNGFWLPMDGNSPIGQDQSGQGNNWTPVNFGGSVALDNPIVSGARPILNTDGGGNVARPGVFGSELNQTIAVTVSNASGNNKYYLDGSLTPNLAFTRGSTITFNTGDSSGNGHPFKLSSTNASGSGGTEYTDGVAYYINGSVVSGSDYVTNYSSGAASGFRGIKWTVPHNQSTTYYYCTIHTGMGNNGAFTSTIDETKADPYAWKNVLALPLVGSANDVSNSVNSGSTTKAIAVNYDAAPSSEQSNFYNGSYKFDGSGDYLATLSSSDFALGTNDWTVEYFAYPTSTTQYQRHFYLIGGNANQIEGIYADGNGIAFGRTNVFGTTGVNNPLNQWNHYALVHDSTNMRLYINGVQVTTTTDNFVDEDKILHIGYSNGTFSGFFTGYLQDFRIYKGVAKYTSDFVVPATSPDILPDTPSGVSGGSKLAKITDGAVSFDGSGDDLEIADSADFEFGTGDFTIECFAYHTVDSDDHLISKYGSSNATRSWRLVSDGNQKIIFYWYYSTDSSLNITSAAGKFSLNRWHHIVAQRTSGDIYLFVDGELIGSNTSSGAASEFNDNSTAVVIAGDKNGSSQDFPGFISNVRIVKGTGVYNTTGFTPPTRTLTNVTNTKLLCCQSNRTSGAAAVSPNISGVNDGTVWSSLVTGPTRKEDRVANAFNGSTSGPGAIAAYPGTLTFAPGLSSISSVRIYGYHAGSGVTLHVNGSAQSPSSGASFDITINTSTLDSIVWTATNGFNYFRIDAIVVDGTTLVDPVVGPDDSNEAATTFNPFTTDINAVRGQETGYPTWNPLTKSTSTLSNGNLTITTDGGSGYPIELVNTFTPAGRGQWYWEFTLSALSGSNYTLIGMLPSDSPYNQGTSNHFAEAAVRGFYVYVGHDGSVSAYSGAATAGSATATIGVGGVVGWAYDAENGTLKCFINGVPQGTQFTNIRTDVGWLFGVTDYDNSATASYTINFGQNPFKYAPPAGFQPLNAANVRPETVITRPDQYVAATIYSGNTGTQSITMDNSALSPDFVWIKCRNDGFEHQLFDSVRGALKSLRSDNDSVESTVANSLTSFDSNGFSLGSSQSVNHNKNFVAWTWKAGGSKNTFNVDDVGYASAAAAGLTGGSITPTGSSVGTRQGFSIIKYQGTGANATIPHGLSQPLDFLIVKTLTSSINWTLWHSSLAGTQYLILNTQGAAEPLAAVWNSTVPTSSVISVGTDVGTNKDDDNYIAYCWHDVPGLQKFGSFEANQNADGPFVELGFRPAIVWIKNIDNYDPPYDWVIYDNARSTINPNDKFLSANLTNVENSGSGGTETTRYVDFLSNGFKVRTASTAINLNAHTQIYCAWAEAPTFNLFGGQSNAR